MSKRNARTEPDDHVIQRDRERYTASFWNDLADLGNDAAMRAALALMKESRWSGLEGAVASGIATTPLGAEILVQLAVECARQKPRDVTTQNAVSGELTGAMAPLLTTWIDAMRAAPAMMVKAAQECLAKGTPTALAVVTRLTAAGMPWEDCLAGERARYIFDSLQFCGKQQMNQNGTPHEMLAALLPAHIEALPMLWLVTLDQRLPKKPLPLLDALGDITHAGWLHVAKLYGVLIERCPAARQDLAGQLRIALGMEGGKTLGVLKACALLYAGIEVTPEFRARLSTLAISATKPGANAPKESSMFLGRAIAMLNDDDGVRLVRWWHAQGLDLDQARAVEPGTTALRIAVMEWRFKTVETLLRLGADPLRAEVHHPDRPSHWRATPLALLQAELENTGKPGGLPARREICQELIALARSNSARKAAAQVLANANVATSNLPGSTAAFARVSA